MGGPGWLHGLAGNDAHGDGEWLLLLCCFCCLIHLCTWTGVKPDHVTLLPPTSDTPLENVASFWKDIDLRIRKHTQSQSVHYQGSTGTWKIFTILDKGSSTLFSLSVCILVLQGAGSSPEPWINEAPQHPPSLSDSCHNGSDSWTHWLPLVCAVFLLENLWVFSFCIAIA